MFFLNILFIFRERGREGEREVEKHQCVVASRVPCTGEPGPGPFGLQAGAQSTEPHQPGPNIMNVLKSKLHFLSMNP